MGERWDKVEVRARELAKEDGLPLFMTDVLLRLLAFSATVIVWVVLAARVEVAPPKDEPRGFPDVVFDDELVVLLARFFVVGGVVFLLVSLIARLVRGHWAYKAAGVETDKEAVGKQQEALDELVRWKTRADASKQEVDDLEEKLTRTQERYEQAVKDLEACENSLSAVGKLGKRRQ